MSLDPWPELPYAEWQDTCTTLHLWTQIVGKIRLARAPWLNHGWQVTFFVTTRGLTTSPIPDGNRTFELSFDLREHHLDIDVSDGQTRRIALRPMSVADFYTAVFRELDSVGIHIEIDDLPSEIPDGIPFSRDHTHASYDRQYVERFAQVLRQVDQVFKKFRTSFLGKSSPVHFFWGSFDLAVTRFSGKTAPLFTGKAPGLRQDVMQEAYSHEVSSAGFWPGSAGIDASFYSYAYPPPPGFKDYRVQPQAAQFNEALGEFVLPYERVRTAKDPAAELLSFLQSTYEAAAVCGKWDRAALECEIGVPGVPRGRST
ncbi:DUF5996 family protein [Steroidobacter cummioxidans]|uniref:DUF5996 family protein n=1 Tax=Steroidobacter cummioxidans TaxID=1803913 RepID=UPI000E31B2D8|nr:DUF5996 family protein [Steroidobacter cummioxidans]